MQSDSHRGRATVLVTWCHQRGGRAFTLIELLVTVGIIALLLAILVPTFASVRQQAKSLLCMNSMRAVAFSFRLFADPHTFPDRGQSDVLYAPRFDACDFQESLYKVSEFWPTDSELGFGRRPYRTGQDPILCSAVPLGLEAESGKVLEDAVTPPWLVSYAMNRRLLWAPYLAVGGHYEFQWVKRVTIGERILDHPNVPLMFDVDAEAAYEKQGAKGPFFSAPPGKTPSYYDGPSGHPAPFWFPAKRHRGKMMICFVGGHVVATADPLSNPACDWEYHPPLDP
ncbi:MAG: type II secretion system protein [Phycisphaerae bacterium]|nr:type II secretion system protein [Phycisphaerae bacterium]